MKNLEETHAASVNQAEICPAVLARGELPRLRQIPGRGLYAL